MYTERDDFIPSLKQLSSLMEFIMYEKQGKNPKKLKKKLNHLIEKAERDENDDGIYL